ncbi:MAG: HisA/HisF-related TIM barrel protein [Crocinitomicaceae bacterium]|nr:HisA/HisF-related TIM barrel protein [Crocinitomicaceae bacterium]
MLKRVIPILLLKNDELVKSIQFKKHKYIGDIINAVKIYNELEVDEIIIMDISASNSNINYNLLHQIATECFMPLSYAGNVNSLEKIEQLIKIGIEKVCINTASQNYSFIDNAVKKFGTSTISICIDYKYINNKPIVFFNNGILNSGYTVFEHIQEINKLNVGEISLQNITNDGMYNGYDLQLLENVRKKVNNPIIIAAGCRDKNNIKDAFTAGANACAAGSLFVYYTKSKGILINYLDKDEMAEIELIK